MKTAFAWIFGLMAGVVLIVGAYYFHDGSASIAVSLVGWAMFAFAIFLAGPRMVELMKLRRRQVDEYWEKHPGNPENGGGG